MLLDTLATTGGAVLLSAAAVRAAIAAGHYGLGRTRQAAQSRSELNNFRRKVARVLDGGALEDEADVVFAAAAVPAAWQGTRPFRVVKRIVETSDGGICSFYLHPTDGRPMPAYRPGQFLSFEIPSRGTNKPTRRCYSLSEAPVGPQRMYRVSVKRIEGPEFEPGLGSGYFHDKLSEGQIIDVSAPSGNFCIDQTSRRPVVLIAGGIGITPLLSMLNWLAATKSQREVWLFHGVRNGHDHAFARHIASICQANAHFRCVTFYSRPTPDCQRGKHFDLEGRVSVDVMKALLKARDYEFYMCGPAAMMRDLQTDLTAWGVPASDIKTEKFGSPALHISGADVGTLDTSVAPSTFNVEFKRSGKNVIWSEDNGSLLELAEACGIDARCACRAGQCGTCKVELRSGNISYRAEPGQPLEAGFCLPCIGEPASDLVLDL